MVLLEQQMNVNENQKKYGFLKEGNLTITLCKNGQTIDVLIYLV